MRLGGLLNLMYERARGRSIEPIAEDGDRNCWLDAKGRAQYGLVARVIDRLNPKDS